MHLFNELVDSAYKTNLNDLLKKCSNSLTTKLI